MIRLVMTSTPPRVAGQREQAHAAPLMQRQRVWADSISLNAMVSGFGSSG